MEYSRAQKYIRMARIMEKERGKEREERGGGRERGRGEWGEDEEREGKGEKPPGSSPYQFRSYRLLSAPECHPQRVVSLAVHGKQICSKGLTEMINHCLQLVFNGKKK